MTVDVMPRDKLLVQLAELAIEAELLSRRGYVGNRSERYADLHNNINAVLTQLERTT